MKKPRRQTHESAGRKDSEVARRSPATGKTRPASEPDSKHAEEVATGNQAMMKMLRGGKGAADEGRPLDGGTRSRMESAFGTALPDVRIHTGPDANRAAGELGARAFALGHDVAFRSGEFQPGTPVGDAVLAHELAHVLQQRDAVGAEAAQRAPNLEHEQDADRSAVGVLTRLWTAGSEALGQVVPRTRSGLALSRCSETEERQAQAAFQAVVSGLSSGRMQPIPIPFPDPDTARGMMGVLYGAVREDHLQWQADGTHSPRYVSYFGTNYPDWRHYSQYGGTFGEIWPHFLEDAWNNRIVRESQRRRSARMRGAR